METKNRREIFSSLASLLAAPVVLGKEAVVETFLRPEAAPEPQPRLVINPPAHSVKRHG